MNRFASRLVSFAFFLAFALLSVRLIARDSRFVILVMAFPVVSLFSAWLTRRRLRRALLTGDVAEVLGAWKRAVVRVPYPETAASLMAATAYAAYGFIDAARDALLRASRGPGWDGALEQRLFVEALLDVYEGERLQAVRKAAVMEQLPLPPASFWMRRKVGRLRRGMGALARAFAHTSRDEDEKLLSTVASSSPLVHWAMRYARAVFLVDRGRAPEARQLLADAPRWPSESVFRAFHDELVAVAEAPNSSPMHASC